MGKILKLITAVIAAACCWSCNTSGCLQNQSSVPLAGFFSSSSGEAILVDSLYIFGIGAPNDSSLIYGRSASMVYLPLRSSASSTAFCIHYMQKELSNPLLNDTITIDYASEARFVSEECGAMYCYTINSIAATDHFIDSVTVIDPYIDNLDIMRLKIYFRVQTEDEDEEEDPDEPHL